MNNLINGFSNINTYSNIPITQFYASSLPVQNLSISDDDKVKYEKYFYQMNPINGYIDGSTAKQFFIKSGLPTMVLASIWDLADINKDGMLDKTEFFIAMHLITIKKAGQNIPVMKSYNNVDSNQQTSIAHTGNNCDTTINLFNSQLDWLIPLPNRIRYQQTFKQNDVNNLGYLNGSQAKNIFLKTQLPQNILAQIWNLSDLNCDGSLELEEFILASYLAEEYKSGNLPKMYDVLPPTLIPPKYRRKRSITSLSHNAPPPPLANTDSPPQKSQMMKQATFEEKRRENFDKGAAILEQKREALIRAEAAERAERQRRESLELESKRLIVMEQEKKRVQDYEKMLEKQKEAEKSNDMEKISFYMAKEEARKELDQRLKQDMLDNKIKELMHTIKAEKEILCRLKAREKDLDCDIQNMEEKILNVKQTHTETRNVSNKLKESKDVLLKLSDDKLTSIQTLQSQLQNFESRLNNEVKEKAKCKDTLASFGFGSRDNLLDAENDLSHSQIDIITPATQEENEFKRIQVLSSISESKRNPEVVVPLPNDGFGFESFGDDFGLSTNTIHSKNIPSSNVEHIPPTILNISKTVKNTLESCLNSPIKSPPSIKSVNSSNKVSLASTSSAMVNKSVKSLTSDLNNKLILHDSPKHSFTLTKETLPPTSPKSPDFKSIQISDKSKITNNNTHTGGVTEPTQLYPYKAIFPFEARSEDELSFNMGDVIMVAESEICEEGWLGGKIGDKIGWFPSSYAVKIESALNTNSPTTKIPLYPAELQQLTTQGGNNFTVKHQHEAKPIKALAIFSLCTKIKGDLSFEKGDIITIEKELDENWWIASLGENKGYVPKSYVKIIGNSETIVVDASSANNSPFNSSRPMSSSAINFEPQTTTKQNNKDSLWSSSRSESSIAADGYQQPVSTIDPFTNTTFQTNSNNIDNVTNVIGKSITTSSLGFESTFTTSTTKDANQTYVAMFPFSSQEPGDLDLKVGDMVLLDPSQSDTDWWKGTNLSTNLTGIFPKNYVKKATLTNTEQELKNRSQTTTPSSNKVRSQSIASVTSLGSSGAGNVKSNLYVAIAPFTATGAEQLTLVPGAIITLRRKTPAGWWEGEIIQTQKLAGESKSKRQLGWFPGTHVKPYNADDTPISKSPNMLTTNDLPSLTTKGGKPPPSFSTPVMVKALFDYDSSHTGDLNFKKGDLIQITDKSSDPSWWSGINVDTKQTGLFPSNYVSPC